uniref:Phosphoinositide phospholipase C n=1 Tax=Oryzias sinensis TaxID=183150 RepID=A0A8C7YKW7_9TELE
MTGSENFYDLARAWSLKEWQSRIQIYATWSKVWEPPRASLRYPNSVYGWASGRRSAGTQPRGTVEKCMSSMQMGTQMVKLRGGSKGLVRFFFLDEHKSCIRWRPSRKNEKAKISIDSIREVCEGKRSEIFQRYAEGSFNPNCCFSLYYGEHMESLDLVSGTGEDARTWITGLKYLMAGISDEDSLAKRQRTRDQWLKQTFTEADKNGDGSLSISEVLQLLHKLNVNLPRQKVKQMFKEADTDDNQGTLDFEEFCSFYKMMSTRRDLYLLMLTYSNHKDHMDTDDLTRFLEHEQKMTKVTKDHCLEIINKFEPCSENQKQGVLGIDGFTNYMRSPAGDIFNPEHYSVSQDMTQPLCNYFIASSHNTYLMGDQLMSQSRVDMYAWVLQAGCRCVEVDCWDGQDGEPIVHHGYTLTSKILFRDVVETINKYAFIKNDYPVILSIENHCSVPQQKKMAQYLTEILGDKLDVSSIKVDESGRLPSPESLRGKILVKGKKLPPNIDENAEEGDVSDEDSADEMEDDCKLMNGDTTANRKQVENMAKKKLDSLMKESKIRDREDPDSFTIGALPPAGKPGDNRGSKGKSDDSTDTTDEAHPSSSKRSGRSFIGSFSKRKKKASKLKKTSSFEDTDTDQESSSASRAPPSHSKKKKTMKLSRALSDLVKYTCSVGLYDIEAQAGCSWQVSSLSETKAHQVMQQKATSFILFNQRQLSRIYPSSYRVDSSNFNPQPFWNAGCQLVALNYQSEGRVLQLNRAKFYSNGNCGYILKPTCMCEGAFNPNLLDPVPGRMKKQLVLKIISGQQLPKPKDSMLGDRGEARAASGIKGLFHRNPKQSSLDSHAAVQQGRKHPFGAHLLRRTASAPTRGQPKVRKGFPEMDTKDYSSEGASEERDSEDKASASYQFTPPRHHNGESLSPPRRKGSWEHPDSNGAFCPEGGKDFSLAQNPAPPPHPPAPTAGDGQIFTPGPDQRASPHHLTSTATVSLKEATRSILCPPLTGKPEHHSQTNIVSSSSGKDLPRLHDEGTLLESQHAEAVAPSHPMLPQGTPTAHAAPLAHTRRALFSDLPGHTPMRRAKSEGHVRAPPAPSGPVQSVVPEVSTDATANDRLWSKLEPGSHRDSMSSSSSISSNDTVIDLSLSNLAWRSHAHPPSSPAEPPWINYRHSALVCYEVPRVDKSKSNPNLQQSEDALKDPPAELGGRRHSWSRLYMEGLKNSSGRGSSSAAAPSMSKSLGDLTSDDISCNFDSKYRSINRSFVVRSNREQHRRGGLTRPAPQNNLTEQLRRLTDVEPLTARDFAYQTQDQQEDAVDESLVRRTSSRSQSRVRYIANRAKKAQERQRLQGLLQGRSASFSHPVSPIEERGNPEGACCVARSPCSGLDTLSRPISTESPSPAQTEPGNSEVLLRLEL